MKKILAFAGSNSSTSINKQLIDYVSQMVKNTQVEILDLRDFEAPIFGVDMEAESGFPTSMINLKNKFDTADGFIVSIPEHNGSMPAVLKNSLDWISRMGGKIFQNKPVLFTATSPGERGASSALDHVMTIMPHRGAEIVDGISIPSFSKNFVGGKVIHAELNTKLQEAIQKLEQAL